MELVYLDQYHFFNRAVICKEPTVVKVGVCGYVDLKRMREMYPKARIVGYEADKDNYESQKEGIAGITDAFYNKGVSDGSEMVLYKYKNTVSHSSYPRHTYDRNCVFDAQASVGTVTIKQVCEELGKIDLLILNCEGGEVKILNDLVDNNTRNKISQMCVSFHDPRIYPTKIKNGIISRIGSHYHIIGGDCPRGNIPDILMVRKD